MNFEDIVDMEWVDTHTTLEDTSAFSSEFYFDHQPDFLLDQPPLTPPQQPLTMEPEIKMEPITTMPTTEQIKQLIEIAKRQLALREQQYNQQQQQQQQQAAVVEENNLFQPILDTTTSTTETQMDTAAPSSFFSIPPIPALSPTTVATSEITAAENATTLETLAKQMNSTTNSTSNATAKTTSTSSSTPENVKRRDSLASMPDEAISLEAYAEADGIDLKKLTPKERRQLRNKLSARNFRVRRKEYISTLEGQVNDHKLAAEALKEKLVKVEEENKKLRKEMDTLKRQNQILLSQKSSSNTSSTSSPRLQKPNLNKDLSIMGTKATDSYRQQDNFILVSNAVMPVWDYNTILNQKQQPKNDYLNHLVGQFLLSVVQLASTMPRGTNQMKEDEYRLPLMPDDRDFSSSSTIKSNIASSSSSHHYTNLIASTSSSSSSSYTSSNTKYSPTSSSLSYMEDLYDVLIQSALINNSNTDKSFWWWDNSNNTPAM